MKTPIVLLLLTSILTACGDVGTLPSANRLDESSNEDLAQQPPAEEPPADPVAVMPPVDPTPSPTPAPTPAPTPGANAWIAANFMGAKMYTGAYNGRISVEVPAIVKDATGTNGKYAFAVVDAASPTNDKRVAFQNVTIKNLTSSDAYGAGIGTSRSYEGTKLFLSNVYVEPNWPTWKGYESTNYDGIVLDGSLEFYAEDLTIKNWNADAALDIKSDRAQFSRLTTEGKGHRTLRFWATGPHYIVESKVNNTGTVGEGSLLWISSCSTTTIYVYNSKFNGADKVPANKIACDSGSNPNIVYLTKDPRTTGEMHPMFKN